MSRKPISLEEKIEFLKNLNLYVDNMSEEDIKTKYNIEKQKIANKKSLAKKKNTIITEPVLSPFQKIDNLLVDVNKLIHSLSYDEITKVEKMFTDITKKLADEKKNRQDSEIEKYVAHLVDLGCKNIQYEK